MQNVVFTNAQIHVFTIDTTYRERIGRKCSVCVCVFVCIKRELNTELGWIKEQGKNHVKSNQVKSRHFDILNNTFRYSFVYQYNNTKCLCIMLPLPLRFHINFLIDDFDLGKIPQLPPPDTAYVQCTLYKVQYTFFCKSYFCFSIFLFLNYIVRYR